ncbi:shikimate dehydrogenase [Candidatus Pelagibacter sp.]|jgi:shikimate dehydrogenase|nr:shikimate dehydrogenase [Candidatus Pelagibacter sp.]
MKKYLVIGNPIGHSLSPLIHNYWMKKYRLFDSVYEKRKVEEKNLKNIVKEIRDDKIVGVNVTVPFKKLIIPFLDKLDFTAKKTESVNTILKVKNKVIGYNTDQAGFALTMRSLFPNLNDSMMPKALQGKNILVLGAGGVTSSIIDALENESAKIFLSNRTKKKAEELKKKYTQIEILDWGKRPLICDIIINTTSIGLTKDEKINIDFSDCNGDKNKLFYDLIYNPKETSFLKEAKLRGNRIMNGKMMFLNQAIYAFNLWTNITPKIDDEVIKLLDR